MSSPLLYVLDTIRLNTRGRLFQSISVNEMNEYSKQSVFVWTSVRVFQLSAGVSVVDFVS